MQIFQARASRGVGANALTWLHQGDRSMFSDAVGFWVLAADRGCNQLLLVDTCVLEGALPSHRGCWIPDRNLLITQRSAHSRQNQVQYKPLFLQLKVMHTITHQPPPNHPSTPPPSLALTVPNRDHLTLSV